jgi:hypothetical protein
MSDDFQQTVDLKTKKEAKKTSASSRRIQESSNRAQEIDQVYDRENGIKNDLRKFDRYQEPQVNENVFRKIVILLALVLVFVIGYFMIFSGGEKEEVKMNWYAVKLVTGEIYYGEIEDKKTDPVEIRNVYYNYDQIKNGKVNENFSLDESSNLRLVKRGKETHGPAGSMDVVRSQVVYMEPLKEDSKVLKAIMNYEK